jgi:hypothetical protein
MPRTPLSDRVKQSKHAKPNVGKASISLFTHLHDFSGPHIPNMEPPNLDPLSLSDSDSDALFDTPAAKKSKKKAHTGVGEIPDGGASGKTRGKESHYTAEEAREAQLRQELDNVRNVNKVIEGVVESLQKARENMDVGFGPLHAAVIC